MKFIDYIRKHGKRLWTRETCIALLILIASLAVFLTINQILTGSAAEELATAKSASSVQTIYNNPVNAPYKITALLTSKINSSVLMLRFVSFSIYAGACFALFFTLKHWHREQAAILATLAFATNSIVLASSHLGTALISMFAWFIFAAMLLWQMHSRSNRVVPIFVLLGLGMLIYIPGVLWFFSIMSVIYINKIKKLFRDVRKGAVIAGVFLALLLVVPLIASFVRDSGTLKEWLLLPENLEWGNIPRSILRIPSAFLYRMPDAPLINISRLPVFDLVSGMLFLVGLNAYRRKVTLDRTRMMIGIAITGIVVGALGQTIAAVILLLPFAFSVIAAGIEFLLDEWQTVFPKNIVARGFGSLVITVVVLLGSYYQLTKFFVAWPHTPESKSTYALPTDTSQALTSSDDPLGPAQE